MSDPVITLDVDWAPDFMIDHAADILVGAKVSATWFVTHASPAIDRLREHPDLFELGIHPNFLPGSSHGDSPEDILKHCLEIVPGSHSIRNHSLVQSTLLLDMVMKSEQIKTDGSLFLPYASNLEPVTYSIGGRKIVRIPFYWEDDYEMEQRQPNWDAEVVIGTGNGLKVFNFHPVHLYLNSVEMGPYKKLVKRAFPLHEAKPTNAADLRHDGEGPVTLFRALVDQLAGSDSARTFMQIHNSYLSEATK